MNELQPLLDLLGGEQGRLAQIVAWMGAIRVPLKLVSGKLQAGMERAIARVLETEDPDDDRIVEAILHSKPYRVAAFLLDWVASIKLPMKLK